MDYIPISKKIFADGYFISELCCKEAMNLVIANHYMHRKCPCSKAFGLISSSGEIKGVVTYGVPCSSTLLKGICGEEEMHNIYELNRVWIADDVPKNAESFLVGNTIKLLDKEIIVSYSDTSVGHVGYIYQATNFLYCGLSAKFTDPRIRGFEGKHHASFAHGMTYKQIIDKYGAENVYFVERPRKHRYVYFNAPRYRKKELMKKLRYTVQDYPKGNTQHHVISETYGY